MKPALKKLYLALMLLFLYAPIFILIFYSFNSGRSRANWTGFSLKWYKQLLDNRDIMSALYNTIVIAVTSSFFATIIGTAAALGLNKMRKLPKRIIMAITDIPMLNPDIVTGVSMMILFTSLYALFNIFELGFLTLLIAHITFNIPYVIVSVLPKLRQLDDNLFEAAQDLGATPISAFFKVILPEIMPAVITGAIFAFTLSIDDFIISYFTTGRGVSNLSIIVYSSAAKKGVNPEINALSTIMFVVVMILLLIINKRGNGNKLSNDDINFKA